MGFDPLTVAAERAAILNSRDTGTVAISSKLTLAQDADKRVPGFVMYVPLYRNGTSPVTEKARRSSFVGWIDAPVRIHSFMARAFPNRDVDIDYEIFDGPLMSVETLLFDSDNSLQHLGTAASGTLEAVKQLQFGGHTWTVSMRAQPGFGGLAARKEPLLIGAIPHRSQKLTRGMLKNLTHLLPGRGGLC